MLTSDIHLKQKRRSARNVKRKQYTENVDYQLSDDDSGNDIDANFSIKANETIVVSAGAVFVSLIL